MCIADKGGTGVDISKRVNVYPPPVHRMTVGKSAACALGKTRRLLHLADRHSAAGHSPESAVQRKNRFHRLRHLLGPCAANGRATPLRPQEIKAHTAHIAEIVCHLDNTGKLCNIVRRDDCGQADLHAALRKLANPCDNIRCRSSAVRITAKRIVHRGSAVKTDANPNARTAQKRRRLLGQQCPVGLQIHACRDTIAAHVVCHLTQQRQCKERFSARELQDKGHFSRRREVDGTPRRLPCHRVPVLRCGIAVATREITVSGKAHDEHAQRHRPEPLTVHRQSAPDRPRVPMRRQHLPHSVKYCNDTDPEPYRGDFPARPSHG